MDSPPSSCTHHRYQTSHTAQLLTSSQTAAAAAAADITGEWFSQTCESVPNGKYHYMVCVDSRFELVTVLLVTV